MKSIAFFTIMLLSGIDIVEANSAETVNCLYSTTNHAQIEHIYLYESGTHEL